MINLGEIHCHWCGDAFEPEGIPSFDEPNFCSDDCSEAHHRDQVGRWDYSEARYGSAPVF